MEAHVRLPRPFRFLALLRGFVATAGLSVLAWIILAAGPVWANGEPGHASDHAAVEAEHGPKDHHEPTAMEHVMDSRGHWEFFESIPFLHDIPLPPRLTKFMILEMIAALLIIAIYVPLARRAQRGVPLTGWKDNAFEVLLTFVRNEIAKPSIGEHDADRYVPFLWTLFLFILFNNLLGIIPFGASATASIYVTGALALIVFFAIHGAAIAKMGFAHYIGSLWPHIELHWAIGLFIKPLIFVIEIIGVLVRNAVLAVRLFANMFAGHMVLATILIFIYLARNTSPGLWGAITFSSVLGIVALSLLEIFVAFLQAYIFVFLTAIFMGMAMHPEH
jgi:F-type H+-transporting ATPase subunit a